METEFTIRDLRREKGWTLADLADALGLTSRSHVNAIENGARCSTAIALKLEALSDGRIAAGRLCPDVALVEAARGIGQEAA